MCGKNGSEIMNYAFYDYPIGCLRIGYLEEQIVSIGMDTYQEKEHCPSKLTDMADRQLREYFMGVRKKFTLPIGLNGTAFQVKVWETLLDIPYGETRSYKDIAKDIGSPKAYRAVGMANHKNPIMIVVPCHRVIGTNGKLTGYAGGIQLKQRLLEWENKWNTYGRGKRELYHETDIRECKFDSIVEF